MRKSLTAVFVFCMATSLYALDIDLRPCKGLFPDVPATSPLCGYIEKIYEFGVTTGYPDGTFRPNEPVTRGQIAALLLRSMALTSEDYGYHMTLSAMTLPDAEVGVMYDQMVDMGFITAGMRTANVFLTCYVPGGYQGIDAIPNNNKCWIVGEPVAAGPIIIEFLLISESKIMDKRIRTILVR